MRTPTFELISPEPLNGMIAYEFANMSQILADQESTEWAGFPGYWAPKVDFIKEQLKLAMTNASVACAGPGEEVLSFPPDPTPDDGDPSGIPTPTDINLWFLGTVG